MTTPGLDMTTETIWREFHADLLRFVARRVSNPADAEDVVQRVFLQVHRALPTLRDSERLPAWLHQMTRRAIVDFYRTAPRRREVPSGGGGDFDDRLVEADANVELSALAELAGCLRPLMAQLSEPDRQALALVEFAAVSQVDAAAQLGVSVSGMKSRVQRARRRLREVVEACCRIELDRRGGVAAYEAHCNGTSAGQCGCGRPEGAPVRS
jgi:RNA polymerase sigma-70 factor (ECF subfamily)